MQARPLSTPHRAQPSFHRAQPSLWRTPGVSAHLWEVVLERRGADHDDGEDKLRRDVRAEELHGHEHRHDHRDRVRVHARDVVGVLEHRRYREAVERVAQHDRPRPKLVASQHAARREASTVLHEHAHCIEQDAPRVELDVLPVDGRRGAAFQQLLRVDAPESREHRRHEGEEEPNEGDVACVRRKARTSQVSFLESVRE